MRSLILILLLSTPVSAQIGIGHSVPLWGKTIKTAEISYQVDRFSVHYFWNYTNHSAPNTNESFLHIQEINNLPVKRTSSLAVSYSIIDKKYFSFSPAFTFNNFPTPQANRVNFIVELNLPITKNISLHYKHLSNGFGVLNKENVGYDSFSLRLNR